jgi:glutamine amidotransferase
VSTAAVRGAGDIVVVDYGMGNIRSVVRALERIGASPQVSSDADRVRRADRLIVPGVGAMGDCMTRLRAGGLAEAVKERIVAGAPYLGICLGLQILLERGEEGNLEGLGLIKGRVQRFPDTLKLAVPHMGWNLVEPRIPHPLLELGYFYFVHAYRAVDVEPDAVLATTEYGNRFASAIGRDSMVAVQFHPEKSQSAGLALLEKFCRWSP